MPCQLENEGNILPVSLRLSMDPIIDLTIKLN